MNQDEKIKELAINSLENAIRVHEHGPLKSCAEIDEIGDRYEEAIDKLNEPIADSLYITMELLSGWCDSCYHDWQFYPGLNQNDWPLLAQELLENLQNNKEITNQKLKDFRPKPQKQGKGIISQLINIIKKMV